MHEGSQNNLHIKKSDLIIEGNNVKIKEEPLDYNEKPKPKRSKWIRWLLDIIDYIVTTIT